MALRNLRLEHRMLYLSTHVVFGTSSDRMVSDVVSCWNFSKFLTSVFACGIGICPLQLGIVSDSEDYTLLLFAYGHMPLSHFILV